MENWIVDAVQSRALRRIIAGLVALGLAAAFLVSQTRYVRNFLQGPYELNETDFNAITDIATTPRIYVTVTGNQRIDTGIQHVEIRKKRGIEQGRTVTTYYALDLGTKILICKGEPISGTTYVGELSPMDADFRTRLFANAGNQEIRDLIYPYMLDTAEFRVPGYIFIVIYTVFLIFLLIILLPAWKHWRDPSTHAVIRRLNSWGDPDAIAALIEAELQEPRFPKRKGWSVTDSYLVQRTFFSFELFRMEDLLWAYKTVTQHRIYLIPTSKTIQTILVFVDGTANWNQRKVATADEILDFVAQRVPWALVGYDSDIEALHKKKPAELVEAVALRKQHLAEGSENAPGSDVS